MRATTQQASQGRVPRPGSPGGLQRASRRQGPLQTPSYGLCPLPPGPEPGQAPRPSPTGLTQASVHSQVRPGAQKAGPRAALSC